MDSNWPTNVIRLRLSCGWAVEQLDWTAEGGSPHMSILAGIRVRREAPWPARLPWEDKFS